MQKVRPRFKSIDNKKIWKEGVKHLAKQDAVLGKIAKKLGVIDMKLRSNYYEAIVRSIIFQQISGKAGAAIVKKFEALYKGRLPTPKRFLSTPEKKVRGAGISPQKFSYLIDLCQRLESNKLELNRFADMPNEEIIAELDAVRGIGRWTAEMFLMFSLGRVDVVPFDDLGFKKAIQKNYQLRNLPDKKKLANISAKWQPYGTIATIYLWRSLDK